MIEVNLSPSKKSGSITNVAGIDLSLINVKMLVISLVALYIPEMVLLNYYDSQTKKEQTVQSKLNEELKIVQEKVQSMNEIEKQVDALKSQEEKLAKKLEVVKEIINKRQNPFKFLKYIAENTPDKLWLTNLELDKGELKMVGYSKDFNDIGDFLANLKNSIFFNKDISYAKPQNVRTEIDGIRVEPFEIKAKVLNFE